MKNIIFYYYDLKPLKVIKNDKYYYFEIDNNIYYFSVVKRSFYILEEIMMINNDLYNSNFMKIIYNKFGSYVSFVNGNYYILVKGLKNSFFSLDEFFYPYCFFKNKYIFKYLDHSNWSLLFSKKIDYFEYQKDYIKFKYRTLYNTVDYFIGLTEIAISYFNAVNRYFKRDFEDDLVLSRIRVDDSIFSFYHPLNIVIDNKARDSAEYLKYLFVCDRYDYEFIFSFLNKLNYSIYQYCLLMARLLYPSFYFDLYEKIINSKIQEIEIVKIIKRSVEYEKFLKCIYNFLVEKKSILKIDFLESN